MLRFAALVVVGCSLGMTAGCGGSSQPKPVPTTQLSDEFVSKLTAADLENPNVNILLTPEQRKSVEDRTAAKR